MITAQVLREYRRLHREYISSRFGPTGIVPSVKYCLEYAKRKVWVQNNWTDAKDGIAYSNDGNWRLRVMPDDSCTLEDLAGDMFNIDLNASTVPGGRRTIEAERKEWESRLQRDGVWGYVLEKRIPACPTCDHGERWDHIDSCWGFECEVDESSLIYAQFQAKGD